MAKIKITEKGKRLLEEAEKKDGIFPNHIYLLSAIRNGEQYDEGELKDKLKLTDWAQCTLWLSKNSMIECSA